MRERRRIRYLIIAAYVFTAVVFAVDMLTPHGVAEWVLYVPIILTPVWFSKSRHVVVVCAACSALVIVGFFLSPPGIEYGWAVMNRVFVLAALWLTALAGIIICNRSTQLAEALMILKEEMEHRKQMEQELIKAEERLRLAMHGVGMGTWDVSLQTGEVLWSPTQFRIFGYEPTAGGAASRGMWLDRVHPDDRMRVLETQEHVRKERALYHVEYRICLPGQSQPAWIEVFGLFHYNGAGTAVRFIGVCFDITRRKELEEQVLEVAAREQRQIGQELHDGVGQELTGLGLMAQALSQRLPETSDEKMIATRLLAGLDQVHKKVRELSRGLIPVHVEARGLPAALEDLAARTAEQSGISVSCQCPDWVEMPDHATATQMFRIAQEAVTNAMRHGRPRQIRLSLIAEPGSLRLRIKDDGTGIQGRPRDGDGLGLRIMRYRADLIGGLLQIGSPTGGGTVVTCSLPRRQLHGEKELGTVAANGENSDRG